MLVPEEFGRWIHLVKSLVKFCHFCLEKGLVKFWVFAISVQLQVQGEGKLKIAILVHNN